MTDRELSIALREMARTQVKPLCDEWYKDWQDGCDVDTLLEKYVKGFDFAVENDYPPLEFIRKYFKKEDLHRHHIYLDENIHIDGGESGYYVFLGNCGGTLIIDGFKAVTVYVRHFCNIDVQAKNGSRVQVTYYDRGKGVCSDDGWSRIRKYDRTKKEG